ncbi:unnamed protein product [Phytomonas sp. Hart1]|nr:unnamed protein product [Phytomonas sp. Hart1]|eukprot:CCW67685.1 unnamed protein product [Phytomonas sp. isolate Hart1]
MVPLPVFKFVFLGIRQLTKPITKHVVARANAKKGITHKVCIGLGRISLGLSGVITEWSNKEMQKQAKNEEFTEEENRKAAKTPSKLESEAIEFGGESPSGGNAAPQNKANPKSSSSMAKTDLNFPQGMESKKSVNAIASATPRSRSLLEVLTYGPQPKESDRYDSSIFVNPRWLAGGVARILIGQSYHSAWAVFRTTFLSPFPEERLVNAGVDLLIEMLAYMVLASLLFWELSIQSKANAAKEAKIDEMEKKLNQLVDMMHSDGQNSIIKITPVQILNLEESAVTPGILSCAVEMQCEKHSIRNKK